MENNIRPFLNHTPFIHPDTFIDPTATIIGQVTIDAEASIWPGVVIRGDVNKISIGFASNVQDLSVLHVEHCSTEKPEGCPLTIGKFVTIGHKVLLHGCTIEDESLIGMGSIILDDAVIEKNVLVGAGSLVPARKRLESGFLYMGSPIKKIRPLTIEEIAFFKESAQNYQHYACDHIKSLNN
ncbi:gamma carbonic anhydrase family protein [Neisseria sp. Ec49-e6-T10]|uniref:gamma carbonic anhydrase family protein n=1 Tax=Neisseria sp. Ec49-e6-T10 TaxID=3140744 RepID=UPI003EBA56C5